MKLTLTLNTMTRTALAVLTCVFTLTACADEKQIKEALAERLPKNLKIDSIEKSPIAGLYEVRIGADIIYANESGSHIIFGNITDSKTGRDFTQERLDSLAVAAVFNPDNLKNALKLVKGNGSRQLVVFEDANCGYCKKLRQDMEMLTNVTIYTYLIPILAQDSETKMQGVWCAPDRNKAYDDWMLRGTPPPASDNRCTAPVEANVALSQSLRIKGTPAVFFKSGKRVPGYLPLAQLEAGLAD